MDRTPNAAGRSCETSTSRSTGLLHGKKKKKKNAHATPDARYIQYEVDVYIDVLKKCRQAAGGFAGRRLGGGGGGGGLLAADGLHGIHTKTGDIADLFHHPGPKQNQYVTGLGIKYPESTQNLRDLCQAGPQPSKVDMQKGKKEPKSV